MKPTIRKLFVRKNMAARRGEAMVQEALSKADKSLVKTASLRHQVNKRKDGLADEITLAEQKKQAAQ